MAVFANIGPVWFRPPLLPAGLRGLHYCSILNVRGDTFEKTPLGMLRSLVFHLIDKEPSAYDRFVLIFRKKYEMHQGGWEWREPELKEFLLSEIKQHLPKPLVLLVDALDECSEPHVRDVVGFLEELSVKAST